METTNNNVGVSSLYYPFNIACYDVTASKVKIDRQSHVAHVSVAYCVCKKVAGLWNGKGTGE